MLDQDYPAVKVLNTPFATHLEESESKEGTFGNKTSKTQRSQAPDFKVRAEELNKRLKVCLIL